MGKVYVWTGDLDFHSYCTMWPEMAEDEFDGLRDHIKEHGLQDLVITFNGQIVDGRHRAMACKDLDIPIDCEEWDGTEEELYHYVVGENLKRRHLSQSQRAMIAVDVERRLAKEIKQSPKQSAFTNISKTPEGGKSGRNAHAEAAKEAGVSTAYVTAAKKIEAVDPVTAKKVKDGELTLPEAQKALGIGSRSGNGNGDAGEVPAKFAKLPEMVALPPRLRLLAWNKSVAMAPDGHPTSNQVIKASGVVIKECDNPKTMADAIEEHEEEVAIADESDSDEQWLAQLPLTGQLAAACQRIYYAEALAYRWLTKARENWGRSVATVLGRMKHKKGPCMYRVQMGLKIDPPEKWARCADLTEGGCAGKGHIKAGDGGPDAINIKCNLCHGAGYRVVG